MGSLEGRVRVVSVSAHYCAIFCAPRMRPNEHLSRGSLLANHDDAAHRPRMTSDFTSIILHVIERAPQWMRRDLEAKDAVVRTQAEEALAAMIADALQRQDGAD